MKKLDMSHETKLKTKNEVKTAKKIGFKRLGYKRLGFIVVPSLAAAIALMTFLTGIFPNLGTARVYARDLMKGIKPQKIETVELKEQFIQSTADFSLELFKASYSKNENSLLSPTSVFLALGMTANGADSNTLKEFEALLGKNKINILDLNAYYNSLSKELIRVESGKVNLANSIWYTQDKSLNVKKDFLQVNADYYNASAYEADFNSKQTVSDINNWVKNNTHNLIDKIVEGIDADTIMYLINTVYFEDQWENPYKKQDVSSAPFKLINGTEKPVDFMHSEEQGYLKDDKVQGFIKPYKSGKYSFIALLPNEGISLDSYISSLSGDSFIKLLKNKSNESVRASLPKFKMEYKVDLVDPLKHMGLKECFERGNADFTKMASSSEGNIYVGDVLHKTTITVDTQGTKAGAVTKVEMKDTSMPKVQVINLNRPFVYAIVDNDTKLPLFIGTMLNPEL